MSKMWEDKAWNIHGRRVDCVVCPSLCPPFKVLIPTKYALAADVTLDSSLLKHQKIVT